MFHKVKLTHQLLNENICVAAKYETTSSWRRHTVRVTNNAWRELQSKRSTNKHASRTFVCEARTLHVMQYFVGLVGRTLLYSQQKRCHAASFWNDHFMWRTQTCLSRTMLIFSSFVATSKLLGLMHTSTLITSALDADQNASKTRGWSLANSEGIVSSWLRILKLQKWSLGKDEMPLRKWFR